MKFPISFLILIITGCQAAVPAVPPPPPKAAAPLPVAPAPTNSALEAKIRQQAQYIEALLSQNEALTAKLAHAPAPVPSAPVDLATPLVMPTPAIPATPPPPPTTYLTPNAEGLIDLTIAAAPEKPGEPVNPFSVRVALAGSKEITLVVSGIVAGPVESAIINDRLLRPGETVESLTVDSIEGEAVILKSSDKFLRLPVSAQKVRVRLAP